MGKMLSYCCTKCVFYHCLANRYFLGFPLLVYFKKIVHLYSDPKSLKMRINKIDTPLKICPYIAI